MGRDMFDTMTLTKIVGALCGSLLIFLLGTWAATLIYGTGAEGHGGEHAQAYVIEVASAEATSGEAGAEGPSFDEVLASADPAKGETIFKKCATCHKVDGSNGTGPHLNGVVGRNHAAVEGFAYSAALQGFAGQPWTPEELNHFLTSPKSYAPGTKMSFAGLSKVEDRANVIAWLETQK
jgi:cytochrome c